MCESDQQKMLLHSVTALSTIPHHRGGSLWSAINRMKRVLMVHDVIRRPVVPMMLLATLLASLAGCASVPTDPAARAEYDETNDPLEPVNRKIFDFNQFVTHILLKPVAKTYRTIVPDPGRSAISNFLGNLGEPVIFANNLLQGEFKRASDTAGRFLVNSTFGVGGMIDVASKAKLDKQSGDFGQTLYHWGVPDGPYIVLPILGPSNPRDAIGTGIDGYIDPFGYLAGDYGARNSATIGRMAGSGIDALSRNIEAFDELQRDSIDFYASLRSLARQRRASELRHGEPAPLPGLDSLYHDPADDAAGPPKVSENEPKPAH